VNRRVLSLFLSLLPFSFLAQQDLTGNWLMYFGTNRFTDKWSIHTEFQYRNHTFSPTNPEQLLLRTGLNFHYSKKATVTLGYAYVPSYIYESEQKSPEIEESRIWQQFILTNSVGRIKFEHRYRLEQRFIGNIYKNRFRYRLMLFIPLNKKKIEKGALFLGLYDEVFVNSKQVFFDRNRLYGALGYQFTKDIGLQVGYLHQRVNGFSKGYFQIGAVVNTDFRK